MVQNEIQEQRMREYFIEATKTILRGEGLKGISARNIAEQAGYSYATLYNYFKNIKELIFECVQDFQKECTQLVQQQTEGLDHGSPRISGIIKSYLHYFIQYPGIFELFFLERTTDIGGIGKLIHNFPEQLCAAEWNYCVDQGWIQKETVAKVDDELGLIVTGLLLFYLNRHYPDTYPKFMEMTNQHLDRILGQYLSR